MTYIYPTTTTNVSDDLAAHIARGSVNPGTDYTCGYGSRVVSVAAGTVTDADGNPGGSGGRMVHVDHVDGTGADYLHLSALSVSAGDRVTQGQLLGYSGASGYGDNWYYGPHLHLSFRRRHGAAYTGAGNIDFDALMTSTTTARSDRSTTIPNDREDDMMKYQIGPDSTRTYQMLTGPGIAYRIPNSIHETVLTKWAEAVNAGKWPDLTPDQWTLVIQVIRPATAR